MFILKITFLLDAHTSCQVLKARQVLKALLCLVLLEVLMILNKETTLHPVLLRLLLIGVIIQIELLFLIA